MKKKSDVKITDVLNGKGYKHPQHDYTWILPEHEFTLFLVAPRKSGKTNLIVYIILHFLSGYFHQILVCSPSVKSDQKWDLVKNKKGLLKENKILRQYLQQNNEYPNDRDRIETVLSKTYMGDCLNKKFDGKMKDEDFFEDIEECGPRMEEQKHIIDEKLYPQIGTRAKFVANRILLIIDDQAGKFKRDPYKNPIANFIMKHRHYGVSVIYVTQSYTAITKAIRNNSAAIVMFDVNSEAEKEAIYHENSCGLDWDTWNAMYEQCVAEKYNFMYINNELPRNERIFKNFEYKLNYKRLKEDTDDDDNERKIKKVN